MTGPDEGSRPPHSLESAAAQRLHDWLTRESVALVASGHLHEHRIRDLEGTCHVWAPATSFVTDEIIRKPKGAQRVGFVRHVFEPGRVTSSVVCPEDMITHQFLDHPDFYPEIQEAARKYLAWKQSRR